MTEQFARLEFSQLAPNVQDILRPRVERLGYLGEFFRCTGVQPDILAPFMQMTEALKTALPDRITETGALTVATLMRNDYERHQHERLCRKLGFSDEWIAAVERVAPDTDEQLAVDERAVQRLVIAMIERQGRDVDEQLAAVAEAIGPEQAVAVMFLVGRYVTHALIVNALGLAPPVPSIFVESRA